MFYRTGGSGSPSQGVGGANSKVLVAGTSASALDSSSSESLDTPDLPHKTSSHIQHVSINITFPYQYLS
ncbi:hypothetical protein O3M35_003999 [Rhynocoris fuscipes]|uniref:Uncharacterized protein n=1 Tax=Rhynocoris fuscipes TaxID=488301 RepID=A0AAW1CPC2_9HEMI